MPSRKSRTNNRRRNKSRTIGKSGRRKRRTKGTTPKFAVHQST